MSEEVKRVKKVVEVDVVELKIDLSAEFFDNMEKAKKQVADKRGYDISYGKYIEEAMNDLVKMVSELQDKVVEASHIIQEQDKALGQAEVVVEPEPGEKVEGEPSDVPDELYAHIVKDEDKRVMYQ